MTTMTPDEREGMRAGLITQYRHSDTDSRRRRMFAEKLDVLVTDSIRFEEVLRAADGLLTGLEMGKTCRHCGWPQNDDAPLDEPNSDCAELEKALRAYRYPDKT